MTYRRPSTELRDGPGTGCPHIIKRMKALGVDVVLRACLARLEPAAK